MSLCLKLCLLRDFFLSLFRTPSPLSNSSSIAWREGRGEREREREGGEGGEGGREGREGGTKKEGRGTGEEREGGGNERESVCV